MYDSFKVFLKRRECARLRRFSTYLPETCMWQQELPLATILTCEHHGHYLKDGEQWIGKSLSPWWWEERRLLILAPVLSKKVHDLWNLHLAFVLNPGPNVKFLISNHSWKLVQIRCFLGQPATHRTLSKNLQELNTSLHMNIS